MMLVSTVPIPMGNGTGSWAHNRVAGAGIEPASGGYEPPEVPLLYPAKMECTRAKMLLQLQMATNSLNTAS